MIEVQIKKCLKCGEVKLESEFHRNWKCRDGVLSACKVCKREALRKWTAENREYVKERKKKWLERVGKKGRRGDRTMQTRRYTAKYPEKVKALRIFNEAIRRGEIEKPFVCETCGRVGRLCGYHYAGYSNLLKVIWLCYECMGRKVNEERRK